MQFSLTSLILALGLAGLVQAHMEMIFPPPFKSKANPFANGDVDYSMTAPLAASGSDFPCKGYLSVLGTDAGKPVAEWQPGETYNMTITGGANHGGGSCQASLSFDKGKTWTVIHSYVGNCPTAGTSSLDFKLPEDTPAGDVVFAWSWFNQIGNREMYMNCAAITVTGGSGKRAEALSSRPSMFVANVNNGCSTKEGSALEFPSPGPDISNDSTNVSPPVGTCPSGGSGSGSGSSSGSPSGASSAALSPTSAVVSPEVPATSPVTPSSSAAGAPASSSMYVSPSNPASSANTGSPSSSSPGGVFITVSEPADGTVAPVSPSTSVAASVPAGDSSSASMVVPTSAPAASMSAPVVVPTSAPAAGASTLLTVTRSAAMSSAAPAETASVPVTPANPTTPSTPVPTSGSGSGSGSGSAQTGVCTTEGQWNCVGGSQFQRCASGQWSVLQPMAAGTTCQAGQQMALAWGQKRSNFRRYPAPWRV
ncbi:hypothetical protein G7046_g1406 [Stylonectria norvegica]|nr:hypothetical protein G7046_g1406 [Stylonectria norvegica]